MNKSATLLPPIPYGLDNAGVLDSGSAAALIKESERAATAPAQLRCAARLLLREIPALPQDE